MYADENVIPTLASQKPTFGPQKTIHQRNKSSPALSSMVHTGNLKAAAKRTAFGDLSNTTIASRPSKDDSAIDAKAEYSVAEKPFQLAQDKKATSLLRPAQRPLTVSGLKGLLSTVTTSNSLTTKQPLLEIQPSIQPAAPTANSRKVVTKRSNAVFKDRGVTLATQPVLNPQKLAPSAAPVAPVHHDLISRAIPCQPSQPEIQEKSQAIAKLTENKYAVDPEPQQHAAEPLIVPEIFEDLAAIRSDGIYIDDKGEVRVYQYMDGNDYPEDQVNVPDDGVALPAEMRKAMADAEFGQLLEAKLKQAEPVPVQKQKLAPVSEPEEYWDDEEEEGNYDEEGYVTARSYKSRGDNTTSGATTVLFPKLSQKVKKEIASAKKLIEGSKTKEDIDDEAWDTTMVSEYGTEIFSYMRDLEVRLRRILLGGHC